MACDDSRHEGADGAEITDSRPKSDVSALTAAIIGLSLLAVTMARAVKVGFTHDESFSFLNFVSGRSLREVLFHPFPSANDHYLNSLLMKLSSSLFGASEPALRAHSVLAYVVFLAAAFLIVREICSPGRVVFAFALLNLNPFLIEYFSLARGYAVGLGLMMLSLLFLLKTLAVSFERPGSYAICLAAAVLAALANFTFLNYYLALAGVSLFIMVENRVSIIRSGESSHGLRRPAVSLLLLVAFTSTLLAIVLPMTLRLKRAGEFYYGGDKGFFPDTVLSLVGASSYDLVLSQSTEKAIGALVVCAVLCAGLISLVLGLRRRFDVRSQMFICLPAVALTAGLGTIAQNHLLGIKYLTDRTAILFVPLFILAIIAGIEAAGLLWPLRSVRAVSFIALTAAVFTMAVDYLPAVNLRYTARWRYDADTAEMLRDLTAGQPRREFRAPIRLGVTWYLEPAVNYYAATDNISWLRKVTRASITEGEYDFYYVSDEDFKLLDKRKLTLLRHYELSGNNLLENRTGPDLLR